jgi:hypothetical protein
MKIFNKLKNIILKNSVIEEDILTGIDIDVNRMYVDEDVANDLDKKLTETNVCINNEKSKYKEIVNNLTTVQKINNMSDEDKKELQRLSSLYSECIISKQTVQKKIQSVETAAPTYLEKYSKEIPKSIYDIKEYEEKQRLINSDLHYLEGEKIDLQYQFKRLKSALMFIKFFTIFILFTIAIVTLILTTMFFVYNKQILTVGIISMVITIFLVLWIYIFRRYIIHELKKNQVLQKRAIELLNKTKIKYYNNKQLLDFQYKKYRVNSSEMLDFRWSNYKQNMSNKKQFKNINNNLESTLSQLEQFLKKNGLNNQEYIFEQIDCFSSKEGLLALLQALEKRKVDTLKEINDLDSSYVLLEKMLDDIKDNKELFSQSNYN